MIFIYSSHISYIFFSYFFFTYHSPFFDILRENYALIFHYILILYFFLYHIRITTSIHQKKYLFVSSFRCNDSPGCDSRFNNR